MSEKKHKVPKLRFPGFTGDWERRKLGDVIDRFEYGLNAAATEYDGVHKYIRITDIDDVSHKFLKSNLTTPKIDFQDADTEMYKLKEGDILFARTGASVSKTYLYDINDGDLYFAGFLIRGHVNRSNNAKFVYQNTLTENYDLFIKITSQRSGQPGVNSKEYAEFKLYIPSKEEQEKISSVLTDFDNLIILHQRKLETLKLKKKALLQKLFPKNGEQFPELRFPGFTDAWEQRKLSDFTERVVRKNGMESDRPLTISAQDGLVDQREYFNRQVASKDMSNYYLIKNGEFAYNKSYSEGYPFGAVKRLDYYESGALSTLYIVFKLIDANVLSDFIVAYYMTHLWYGEISKRASEGARNHGLLNISPADFFQSEMLIPTNVNEQCLIGKFFENFDNLITLHQRKLEHLQLQKKALLQQMFV